MSAARMAMSVCARRTFAIRALPTAYRMVAAVPRLARPTAQPVMAQAVRSFHYTCRASDDAATPAKPVFLDKEEVLERVMTVVKSFEKIDPTKVSPTAKFKDDLGLDSLDSVEVVMAIEDEFAIVIPDDEADAILSVEDAVVFISSHPNAH